MALEAMVSEWLSSRWHMPAHSITAGNLGDSWDSWGGSTEENDRRAVQGEEQVLQLAREGRFDEAKRLIESIPTLRTSRFLGHGYDEMSDPRNYEEERDNSYRDRAIIGL